MPLSSDVSPAGCGVGDGVRCGTVSAGPMNAARAERLRSSCGVAPAADKKTAPSSPTKLSEHQKAVCAGVFEVRARCVAQCTT